MKRFGCFFLCLVILTFLPCFSVSSENSNNDLIAVVFTHDLHSHIDSFYYQGADIGGFARIKTFADQTKNSYTNTLVVDGGDFSMGTLYQALYRSDAVELSLMADIGYDAIALGNHEFDCSFQGLVDMIGAAQKSRTALPPLLCANLTVSDQHSEFFGKNLASVSQLGIKEYIITQTDGYSVAIFGLFGTNAISVTPNGGVSATDPIETAKRVVSEIKSVHDPDLIICLSHGGTGKNVDDEDILLAEEVSDIDLIVSGHTHTTLTTPITVNNTHIVSCGEYGINIGRIILKRNSGRFSVASYSVSQLDSAINEDVGILESIESFKPNIDGFVRQYGFESYNQNICNNAFDSSIFVVKNELSESTLGNIISDSYIAAVQKAEGDNYIPIDVSIVPRGVIRQDLKNGLITVSDAFEVLSLGMGADGTPGYPICSVYLTGKELKTIAEVDASVSVLMSESQLYFSGMRSFINKNRMLLNRVYDCVLTKNGVDVQIDDEKLYRVVSGLYSAQMLGTVESKSFGLMSITPKDINGTPITDFNQHIVKHSNGTEVKEWVAFADFLNSFQKGSDGIPAIPSDYAVFQQRKNISDNFSFSEMLKNWNFISFTVLGIFIFICIVVVLIVVCIKKRKKKKRKAILAQSFEED